MTRRDLLRSLAIGSGLAALPLQAGEPPDCRFPDAPRQRLGVASYPFRKDVDPLKGSMKLLDFPKMVVEKFDVRGIEPLDEHFASVDPAYVSRFRQALEKVDAHVINIPVGRLHGSFYDPDSAKRKTAIANSRKWIDVASALGSPSVRVHIEGVTGVHPDVKIASQSLHEVAHYGEAKKIIVNLENDDPRSEDAPFLVQILDEVKSPWLRGLPDFCNSMLLNKGEAYNYDGVAAMFQRACNISHVKEIETDEDKVYKVDIARTLAIAKKAGYRGYLSMEWDSDGDPYAGTKHLIDVTLQALSA